MRLFEELGRVTEERWRAEGYREAALPDVALRVFDEVAPHRAAGIEDVVRYFLRMRRLEPQSYGSIDQRIVIPHHGRRFYVEVIFWVDEVAFPHHHSFSGAFHVLSGLRIHTTYRFEEEREVTSGLRLGRMSHDRTELLETGASRAIRAGDVFIHSLSHIDRPSVSLVIATDDPAGEPQLNYKPPYVAHAGRHGDRTLAAQIRGMELLHEIDPARHAATLARELARADLHSSFELLRHGFQVLDGGRFAELIEVCRGAHGEAAELLGEVFAEERRRLWFLRRRGAMGQSQDVRLLAALLLHVPSRAAILEVIRARYPAEAPADFIARRIPEIDPEIPFDESSLAVLRALLEHRPVADVELGEALMGAPLLSALFGAR